MSFDSLLFAYFFIPLVVLYYALPARFSWWLIILASIIFYLWIDPYTIWVPFLIALLSYITAIAIEKEKNIKRRKTILTLSVSTIIALLVFYKYAGFLVNSVAGLSGSFFMSLIVPLGISYITFQAIGYMIDVNSEKLTAEKRFANFAGYLLFFPKLVAGPVENARHFLPQIKKVARFDYDTVTEGMKQFAWGLFKKLVIANRLSIFVDSTYSDLYHYQGLGLFIAALLFPLQLYADFSGYTDMALGVAKMLGYELSPNFDLPFSAKSMAEFWRKWHITLSSWFNTYFYTPLSIRLRDWGKWGIVCSSFLSFLVLGLWHGANWTFVFFGGIHGLAIAVEFLTARSRKKIRKKISARVTAFLGVLYTFCFFSFSCIFFRSNTVANALYFISSLFTGVMHWFSSSAIIHALQGHGFTIGDYVFLVLSLLFMFFMETINGFNRILQWPRVARLAVYYLFLLILIAYAIPSQSGFIYKQF